MSDYERPVDRPPTESDNSGSAAIDLSKESFDGLSEYRQEGLTEAHSDTSEPAAESAQMLGDTEQAKPIEQLETAPSSQDIAPLSDANGDNGSNDIDLSTESFGSSLREYRVDETDNIATDSHEAQERTDLFGEMPQAQDNQEIGTKTNEIVRPRDGAGEIQITDQVTDGANIPQDSLLKDNYEGAAQIDSEDDYERSMRK